MTTSKPKNSSQHKRNLAAGAAAAAAMYFGPPGDAVDADIVTNTDLGLPGFVAQHAVASGPYWDVDGAGMEEFRFSGYATSFYVNAWLSMVSSSLNGKGFVNQNGDPGLAIRNLPVGFLVGQTLASGYKHGSSGRRYVIHTSSTGYGSGTQGFGSALGFTSGVDGYIGFSFNRLGNTHYGWARVEINIANSFEVKEWAFEDTPNKSIGVGETIPEPNSLSGLALLACGMAGTMRWRRKKAA